MLRMLRTIVRANLSMKLWRKAKKFTLVLKLHMKLLKLQPTCTVSA